MEPRCDLERSLRRCLLIFCLALLPLFPDLALSRLPTLAPMLLPVPPTLTSKAKTSAGKMRHAAKGERSRDDHFINLSIPTAPSGVKGEMAELVCGRARREGSFLSPFRIRCARMRA